MSSRPCPASDGAVHLLDHGRQQAHAQALLLRRLQREPGVLERELERERRREVALDHQLALHARVGRAHRAAVDRVEEGLRVDLERLGQRDRLGEALGQGQQPGVDDELRGGCPRPPRPPTASSRRPASNTGSTRSRRPRGRTRARSGLPLRRLASSTHQRSPPARAPAVDERGAGRAAARCRRSRGRVTGRACSSGPARADGHGRARLVDERAATARRASDSIVGTHAGARARQVVELVDGLARVGDQRGLGLVRASGFQARTSCPVHVDAEDARLLGTRPASCR